jgi:hypothetical protein
MLRSFRAVAVAGCLLLGGSLWGAQQQDQRTVSGPDQWNHKKSTNKSEKKGTQGTTKVDGSRTGQSRRHGNTATLTRNGPDVNGARGEGSDQQKKPTGKGSEKTPDSKQ